MEQADETEGREENRRQVQFPVINDGGRPFRTSGNNGRPAYEYPLGGSGWVPEGTTQ